MKPYPTTDKEIAHFWGIADRTLFRWKADGAPIRDELAMRAWLATRKNLPKSVLEKIQLTGGDILSAPVSPVSGSKPGAAAALKRLQEAELAAWERLQKALAGGNPLHIKLEREAWLKISDALRKYELLVEQSRREAGELIPRAELEKFIVHFCNFSRTAFTARAEDLVNQFVGRSELEIYAVLRRALDENLFATATSYLVDGQPDLAASARRFVRNAFIVSDEEIEKYLEDWLKRATSK